MRFLVLLRPSLTPWFDEKAFLVQPVVTMNHRLIIILWSILGGTYLVISCSFYRYCSLILLPNTAIVNFHYSLSGRKPFWNNLLANNHGLTITILFFPKAVQKVKEPCTQNQQQCVMLALWVPQIFFRLFDFSHYLTTCHSLPLNVESWILNVYS